MNSLIRTAYSGLSTVGSSKQIILLISLLAFSYPSFGKAKTEKGLVKSTFVSTPADAYSFIKKQLTYQGFRKAISVELKKMSLDEELFWSKYEEKFQETFTPTEEKLKETYGIGGDKKVNLVKKQRFNEELRRAKLLRMARFGNLSKVVSRFSVKKISRSTKNPHKRYMRMKVKLNKRSLQKLYMQFISNNDVVQYDRLVVHSDVTIENAAWTDIGVSNKTVLEGALFDSWQKWFVANFSEIANLIEFESSQLSTLTEKKEDEAPATNEDGTPVKKLRELHISLETKIKKTYEDELENYRGFSFKIYINVLGSDNKILLSSKDIKEGPQNFSTVNVKDLSSNVASAIYNLPLKEIESIKSEIIKAKTSSNLVNIKLDHFPSDLITLKRRMEELGLGLGIEASVVNYAPGNSQIRIGHMSSDEKLISYVARLNELDFITERKGVAQYDAISRDVTILSESAVIKEPAVIEEPNVVIEPTVEIIAEPIMPIATPEKEVEKSPEQAALPPGEVNSEEVVKENQ